ncbi:MAG: phosphoglycerate dehydrogenase [Planctomycetota bacterium]
MTDTSLRILVADKIAEPGLDQLRAAGIPFDVQTGLSPADLAVRIGQYDGVLIRSAVKITREVLQNPGRLVVIARAGTGVDNVDLEAATAAGILVLNTPDANTISTAEHTIAMMLALHRRIADAHHHVVSGLWQRNQFEGAQVAGKTLGIVGFGRIGRAVAQRALAFEMKVVAYDPFVTSPTALDGAVTIVRQLKELLERCDCITLHASLSDDSRHMIGAEELAIMKKGARLMNCARGALIDETALADALNSGHLAGAAIDVFEQEPPKGSPLLTAKNVVLTPHLAASTQEAQIRVSVEAADAVIAYLQHGEVRGAVNFSGLPAQLPSHAATVVDLCSRIGTILSPWCAEGVEKIRVTVFGETWREIASILAWQAMVSVVSPHLTGRLTLVNAKEQAERRGISVEHTVISQRRNQPESLTVSVEARGQTHEIEGTVLGDDRPRILAIDGYRMELIPERIIVLIFNDDRPGVIGLVGQAFGTSGINIADMVLSRRGNTALMVLKLDGPLPHQLRDALRAMNPPIHSLHTVALPPVRDGFQST